MNARPILNYFIAEDFNVPKVHPSKRVCSPFEATNIFENALLHDTFISLKSSSSTISGLPEGLVGPLRGWDNWRDIADFATSSSL